MYYSKWRTEGEAILFGFGQWSMVRVCQPQIALPVSLHKRFIHLYPCPPVLLSPKQFLCESKYSQQIENLFSFIHKKIAGAFFCFL